MTSAMNDLHKSSSPWSEIALYVEEGNDCAINMYESLEFQKYGRVEPKKQWYTTQWIPWFLLFPSPLSSPFKSLPNFLLFERMSPAAERAPELHTASSQSMTTVLDRIEGADGVTGKHDRAERHCGEDVSHRDDYCRV